MPFAHALQCSLKIRRFVADKVKGLHAYEEGGGAMEEAVDNAVRAEMTEGANPGKSKGRKHGRAKPAGDGRGKRSLNLSLPYEDYERLAIHALDEDRTVSEVVSELARAHLRRVHLTRRSE